MQGSRGMALPRWQCLANSAGVAGGSMRAIPGYLPVGCSLLDWLVARAGYAGDRAADPDPRRLDGWSRLNGRPSADSGKGGQS